MISGATGQIRSGWKVAATLGGWRFTRLGPSGWALTAKVTNCDEYLMRHGSNYSLRLDLGWSFGDVSIQGAENLTNGGAVAITGEGRPDQ